MLGVMARVGSNGQQFLTTLRVRAVLGHVFSQQRITQDMALRGLKQQQCRLVERVIRLLLAVLAHLRYQLAQAVIQQMRIVDNDVPLPFVRLVDAKNLRADGRLHLVSHLAVDKIFHRALFPVREELVTIDAFVLFADRKTVLRPRRKLFQLFQQPVGVHLWRHNPCARLHGTVTSD